MALDTTKLRPVGTANQFYVYETADDLATAAGSGYWDSLYQQLQTNDVILINSSAGAGGGQALYHVTVDSSAGTVTLTAL